MPAPPAPLRLPLIRHYPPGAALAWAGRAIGSQQFIALARHIAAKLPADRQVINLCEDRYHFLLAFAAALIAGRLTLTPASRAAEATAQIQHEFGDSHALTDGVIAAFLAEVARDVIAESAAMDASSGIPLIPADQPAITLFTSGSSGPSMAHCKTWGMLVQGADQLQRAFKVTPGACVLGTIPPQHMFGLESTIVFPLQWGCTIHQERPLLPADIEHAVKQVTAATAAPVWLMTTPLHLRACVMENEVLHGITGAISATMPLDRAAARDAERILQCPLHEIYGCTESGIAATRRPAHALEWQLCADFRLRVDDGQAWLEGQRLGPAQPLALADRIVMGSPDRFSLQGRNGDMIKIAGKRTSLAALNAALLAIEGVHDGCFFLPAVVDHESDGKRQRLSALVVAPQMSVAQVMAGLRQHVDTVFLPRPLWMVAQLPRDANGKLPRAALEKLAASLQVEGEASAPRSGAPAGNAVNGTAIGTVVGTIAADHPALDGHFPDNPIVPGVLLLGEVLQLAQRNFRIAGLKQVKFHMPLRPGQQYAIDLEPVPPLSVKFQIRHGQTPIASGVLQCAAADGVANEVANEA